MFKKIILLLILILVFLFFYFIFLHYISEEHIKKINQNRSNVEKNLSNEYSNLPFLDNDTNNIIEFNFGFNSENKIKRNFWDLIKRK